MNNMVSVGESYSLACTNPTTPASGDPVRIGILTGVALTDEGEGGNSATKTTVRIAQAIFDLSVKAVNDSGNSAVAAGDEIFYVDADTPKLSKKSSGYKFGIALEAVTSGETATINVLHIPGPGQPVSAGSIGNTQLAETHIQYATVAVTNGQIKALRASPKTLVAAPASGYILKLLGGMIALNAGSNVLTESADNLAVKYTDGSGVAVSETIETTGFIDQAADTYTSIVPVKDAIVAETGAAAQALVLHNTGDGEIAGNAAADATLAVHIWYAVIPAIA